MVSVPPKRRTSSSAPGNQNPWSVLPPIWSGLPLAAGFTEVACDPSRTPLTKMRMVAPS